MHSRNLTYNLTYKILLGIILVTIGMSPLFSHDILRLEHVKGPADPRVDREYPARYDLRDLGRVSPRKNAQSLMMMNIYATYSSLESCLMPAEKPRIFNEPFLVFELDRFDHNRGFIDFERILTALVCWGGPNVGDYEFTHETRAHQYGVIGHVQQAVLLPHRRDSLDNNTVKWFIMNHGAVMAQVSFAGALYNEDTKGHYYFGSYNIDGSYNMGITLIGWDDDYPVSNFRYPPPGPGAFIVKSAFPDTIVEDGYFYISYYDSMLIPRAVFPNLEDVNNYGQYYMHDPLGPTHTIGGNTTEYWGANVFTARDDTPLEAVSFYLVDKNATCDIYIYKNTNLDGSGPTNGTLAAVKTARFFYPGYYTVKLDNPIPLQTGEKFTVAVKFNNSSYTAPLCIESPVLDHSSGAGALPGQSFVSTDGENWSDLTLTHPGSNACIKAFSRYSLPIPEPVVHFTVEPYYYSIWLLDRTYAKVTVRVENLDETQVDSVYIYRRMEGSHYEPQLVIPVSELVNGEYSYLEKDLSPGRRYDYFAHAYTPHERVIGRSDLQMITVYQDEY